MPIKKGMVIGKETQWKPGQSGNPAGRGKVTQEELDLVAACKERTPKALAVIDALMLDADKDSVRLAAATYIVDRAFGKPLQRLESDQDPLAASLTAVLLDMRSVVMEHMQQKPKDIHVTPTSSHSHHQVSHASIEVPQ